MSDSFDFLINPFDRINKDDLKGFESTCKIIADNLINNYCIRIGESKFFYFAEIEFYYWQWDKWNDDWNKVTYPRNNKAAGDLFYHYSGIDICFNSSYCEKKFGGILIRAIKDQNDIVTAGPLSCCNMILNNCDPEHMPKLDEAPKRNVIVKSAIRALGKKDMQLEREKKLKLCFYDSGIDNCIIQQKNVWNPGRDSFDKKSGDTKTVKTQYISPDIRDLKNTVTEKP